MRSVVQLQRHRLSQQHLRSFCFFSEAPSQADALDSSGFNIKNGVHGDLKKFSKSGGLHPNVSIASVLEMIVNRSPKDGIECTDPSTWKSVFEKKLAFEPKPKASFGEWLNYVDMMSEAKDSALVIKNIIQILDANHEAQLDWINLKLSFANIVQVLINLETPKAAFAFYKWVKERPYYVPDKSVYMTLIDRLIASKDTDTWDQVHFVMKDMIERKTVASSKQFGSLLALVEADKPINASRMQLYVEWLLKMRPLGLELWFSTYEKVMKLCNKLEMYDSTISIFKCIPNSYYWAFMLAFSACKCTGNVDVAEELFREMKLKNMKLDAKCCNDLLTVYASHGHLDKARNLLEEMEKLGISVDFETKSAFERKPGTWSGESLNSVETQKIVQILDANYDAQLDWINIKLSLADVIHILTNLKNPSTAFIFYKWVRERSYYVPDKSVYTALIDQLIASTYPDTWDQVHFVMRDMIETKTVLDSKQFGRLLALVEAVKPINTSRMQLYIEWLLEMRSLGLELWFSTYEKVMKICNKLEMYDHTISIFKAIPKNSYCWAFRLAFCACKYTGNVVLAEEFFREMKMQNMKLDAKCCNDLLTIYANHGHADKAKSLLEEMKSSGVAVDLRRYASVIHALGGVGRVKEAEDVFRGIEQKLDHGIYRAMAACYRDAGHFNELLALLREEGGSRIGEICFTSAFEACVEKGEWTIAVEILKDMQKWRMSPSPRLYRMIILACSKVNDYSACKALDFNLREMDALSSEDLERIIKMYVSLEKVPDVFDALEVFNERGFGPPTADLFEHCIITFSKTSLTDAMTMYNIMRSVGYIPASSVFITLIEEHIIGEDILQSKKLHDDMVAAGFQLEEHIASLVLPSCEVSVEC